MKKYTNQIVSTLCVFLLTIITAHAEPNIDYPHDYRSWTHVKSMVINEGHALHEAFGGIHHIYANDKALEGYRNGTFPEGSIIIFDLIDVSREDNAVTEQQRKVLALMKKDSARFADTASWGFEGFGGGDPNNPVVGKDYKEACYACHTSQQDKDYVFSQWRD